MMLVIRHVPVVLALTHLTLASPIALPYAADFGYTFDPATSSFAAPAITASQFHAQDEFGQYNYGYSNPTSSKVESKTDDGIVRGAYSYIDANGELQSVEYISDILGFRAVGTNIPVGPAAASPSPVDQSIAYSEQSVRAVPIETLLREQAPVRAATVMAPTVAYSYLPYATNYGYAAHPYDHSVEQPLVAAPVLPTTPDVTVVTPGATPYVTQSRFHAQDELGQYHFGYSDPNSARSEIKTADGNVRGTYNYVDDSGVIQTVHYTAGKEGFRAVGTNIPQTNGPGSVIPQVTVDTPEVAAAKLEHARLVNEVLARDEEQLRIDEANAQFRQSPQPDNILPPAQPLVAPTVVAASPVAPIASVPVVQSAQDIPVAPVAIAVPAPAPVLVDSAASGDPVVDELIASSVSSQYHAQDELGQYSYGYSNQDSSKVEQKTADGVVRGAYKYIDAHGELQTVQYISDAFGFRVAGTNIPAHNEGESNPALVPLDRAQEGSGIPIISPQVAYSYLPYAVNYDYLRPNHVSSDLPIEAEQNVPVVVASPAPVVPGVSSQYHAQDESGQYNYGYSNGQSAKQESRTADGSVRGAYSYIDGHGKVQSVQYISDALGFRAAGTNIPQAPDTPMMGAKVDYSYLPYAVNHAYYF